MRTARCFWVLVGLAVMLAASSAGAQHAPPIFTPGDPAGCKTYREQPVHQCSEPWVKLIPPLGNPNDDLDDSPYLRILDGGEEVAEVWLCNEPSNWSSAFKCFSTNKRCGCLSRGMAEGHGDANLPFLWNWREPADYTDEVMEHVFRPCMRYAVDLLDARDGHGLSDASKDRFVEERMIPMNQPVLDAYMAELNGILNDPIAYHQMGYSILERRKVLYEEFFGKCLIGAVEGAQ